MIKVFEKYILEITIFLSWAAIMIFEITGSRIIGPYFGTSLLIWTSIIGVILWSLSLGYYLWWKIADEKADYYNLSIIFIISVILLLITFFIKEDILIFLQKHISSIKVSGFISSVILFAPVSVILWIISPYTVKLKLKSLKNAWAEVGRLNALSTIWSIFGTFLSGFFLIPLMWTNNIFLLLIIILLFSSMILHRWKLMKIQLFLLVLIIGIFLMINIQKSINEKLGYFDIDTSYSRVTVENIEYKNKKIKKMWINNEWSSAMDLESDKLVFDYTKYYDLAVYFFPEFKKTLMIWWAWYSYPKYFLEKYKDKTIDVIEIDPGLTQIARDHFNLKNHKNLKIIHEDARTFLNKNKEKYDVIYWDAYKSQFSIPYHLTTLEFIKKNYDSLNEWWIVILNIISPLQGEKSDFLKAEYHTYKQIFPQVYLFQMWELNPKNHQNVTLIAIKSKEKFDFTSKNMYLQNMLKYIWKEQIPKTENILTDDYAPVDYYINKWI